MEKFTTRDIIYSLESTLSEVEGQIADFEITAKYDDNKYTVLDAKIMIEELNSVRKSLIKRLISNYETLGLETNAKVAELNGLLKNSFSGLEKYGLEKNKKVSGIEETFKKIGEAYGV